MFTKFLYVWSLITFVFALISNFIGSITPTEYFQLSVYAWLFMVYAGILEIQQILKDILCAQKNRN
jgi:uncharacterized Tic20 family protein